MYSGCERVRLNLIVESAILSADVCSIKKKIKKSHNARQKPSSTDAHYVISLTGNGTNPPHTELGSWLRRVHFQRIEYRGAFQGSSRGL